MNVLVLAPHTDDGELGAGGYISKLISQGHRVTYVAFSIAEDSVPDGLPKDILVGEVSKATESLGILADDLIIFRYPVRKLNYARQDILEDMIRIRRERDFDLVLTPSLNDIHQDHAVIAQESVRAFKNKKMLGYELIWNNLSFNTTFFVKLSKQDIENKCKALEYYTSQAGRPYVSRDFVYSLAKTRGVQIGTSYAECYEVIRWVIN
ncbi:PIG-L deacetylase family protein [Pseudoalteromonas sp. MMG012]|uniref:PIG-L deacetylase family protein n=1 Tax=Pseudoalteromonas sp. MMG012 TaxID=2822686 RepID=UPI001B3A1B8D|nr:PIG-L deacetylase family protein [Pseudoalteromonas sp. MMG012]MBQ4849198.1 PIG-L family deacetylase [Pseudoalteromonas sp. MMG012]